ncbi:MAG TPA: phosphoglucosamine mutase, partial [Thermotoga sp.]|nr:phosphoglucosamine mutase [Thermotoga sp.]
NVHVRNKEIANRKEVRDIIKEYEEKGFRVVVRPSGTEPVIRIMVEGKESEAIKDVAGRIAQVIKNLEGEGD